MSSDIKGGTGVAGQGFIQHGQKLVFFQRPAAVKSGGAAPSADDLGRGELAGA